MGVGALEVVFVAGSEEEWRRVEADLRGYRRVRLRLWRAADAETALERWSQGQAQALLCSCAPGDAAQTAARLRLRAPRAPLVLIVAEAHDEILHALESGACEALPGNEIGGGALGSLLHAAIVRWRGRLEPGTPEARAELIPGARALGPFASVVVHDLHDPLRVVVEYCRLLRLRLERTDDPSVGRYLERVNDAGLRMQEHLAGLLDYARTGARPLARQRIDCEAVLKSALANLKVALEEGGARVTYGRLPSVHADPLQLVQVFQNLIANAIKHRAEAPPEIRVQADAFEGGWRLSVQDNGPGFAPEEASRVFEAFYRLRSAADVPGSGVGLAICKTVIEEHGGRIWAESRPGNGATFHFTLADAAQA